MSQILTDITQQYQQATSGWYDSLFPVAQHIFGVLAVIEIAWSGILWAMHKNEVESLWVEFLQKMLVIGFFYTILVNAQTWVPDIIKSFMQIGSSTAHITGLYPSDILNQGISIAESIMKPLLDAGLLHAGIGLVIGGAASVIVVLSFAWIAAELVVSLIESYMVVSCGVLLLGFSASRFTSDYASRYLNYAVSIGVKLFMLYLVIGVGSTIATHWSNLIMQGGIKNMTPFFEVMSGSLVFLYIAKTIPAKAESLLTGSVNSSGSGLAALTAVATTMMSQTVMNSSVGGMEALKQAATVANQHDYSGYGMLKGAATAGKNILASSIGSHAGHHRTMGSGMMERSKQLQQKFNENTEKRAAKK